jgi:phospholipid-transporting ATPase
MAFDSDEQGFLYFLLVFVTFWILFSYFVPISLFVTMEIVKFWQGFVYVNFDSAMKDRASRENARCRNSNLNEDLGKIDYIFSDKTGTLTSNEMRLRMVAVKGAPLGDLNKALEGQPELRGFDAMKYFSETMFSAVQV